ncbi:hypothetical protein BDQ12DRAFT_596679 [Crucibulum laeve]|uniref:Uncharacterized protein n=1 Tax=Crucibulum laeve TaxID=68775 RepID=A0A5C3MG36_9AGAR|nr:hypothetical protein BDQ12DRAFT_596679 [Crucibulum laeve]
MSEISPIDTSISRRPSRPLPRHHERYLYTYRLLAGATPLQFIISVEPESGRPRAGNYTFRLSFRANGIERPLAEPIIRKLKVDPRQLEFVVFVFPGKSSLPAGCLWSLRVWLRVNSIDHRLFGEDELWVGKDPDFNSIGDASFARLKNVDAKEQVYHAYVGKALVSFIVRWTKASNGTYKYSLEYEANGVGAILFEDLNLKLDGDPRTVTFLIYSVPTTSMPVGASHRLRVWLRSLVPLNASDPSTSYVLPFNDSYIYQRIWKSDAFKVGARLDFESLGSKMVMGFSSGSPVTITTNQPGMDSSPSPRSAYEDKSRAFDF